MIAATEVNGKPVYEKDPTITHMVWASNGYWYVGKRDELGKQAGWMQVFHDATFAVSRYATPKGGRAFVLLLAADPSQLPIPSQPLSG